MESEGIDRHEPPVEPAGNGATWVSGAIGRRGRPPMMTAPELLDRIRRLAESRAGLFRIHHTHSSLYARARRNFGSWSAAVGAAGLDYGATLIGARQRSLKTRRRRARRAATD